MSVHIVLHHEPSLVEETVLEIDWIEVDFEDDDELEVIPTPVMRKVRKVKVTIVEE